MRWARAWKLPSAALVHTKQDECRDWLDWSGRVFLGRFSFLLWSLAGRERTPKTIAETIDLELRVAKLARRFNARRRVCQSIFTSDSDLPPIRARGHTLFALPTPHTGDFSLYNNPLNDS